MSTILGIGSRIKQERFGIGVIVKVLADSYGITFMQYGYVELQHTDPLEVIEALPTATDVVSMKQVELTFKRLLSKYVGEYEEIKLGDKWKGGTMSLQPEDTDLKAKEIPIETFFHKIVMLRDRMRVLEQRINGTKNLSDEEKVNLQQYITRMYGSLTTFNVLFKDKKDHFKGSK
ncbi:MAG: hypothetical protein AB8B69_16465 [Chitinophagales bacterium]